VEKVVALSSGESGTSDRLRELVADMAQVMSRIDIGVTWTGLTCAELDSISAVLIEAGQEPIEDDLLERHAAGDEEGDEHWIPPAHAPLGTAFR